MFPRAQTASAGRSARCGTSSGSGTMEEKGEVMTGAGAGGDGSGWRRRLARRLPVLEWAARYDRTAAVADLVAGVTLGLTLVPQSIAYASLANLPVQYGLYSAYIGTILYVFLGTVKEVSIGPTSLMALLTLQLCRGLPLDFVVLLTFLSGCIVFLMGLLRLGFLVELISPAVTSGFTSATAVIIVVSQLKGLLGLTFVAESVVDNVTHIVLQWHQLRTPDLVLGAVCCLTLLTLRKVKDIPLRGKRARLRKALWLVSIARNALVVVGASCAAYWLHAPGAGGPAFQLSGRVQPGVPRLALPPFSTTVGNRTLGFTEMVHELGSGLAMVPVVMVLANIAIAKAFSAGRRLDATQEMLTLGLVNVAGSMLHAMPTCGAFTRSAVSHSSGVRTPAAGLYSGLITLLALVFLTHYFYYIPKACLSSVLICAVIFMIDYATVVRLWRRGEHAELATLALTFAVSLARTVELAVLAGALASLAALLRRVLRPRVEAALHAARGAAVVRPALPLCYVNAELVGRRLAAAGEAARAARLPLVLLDATNVALLDYTAAQVLARVAAKLKENGQRLGVFRAPRSPEVERALRQVEGLDARALHVASLEEAVRALVPAPAPAPAPAPPPGPDEARALLPPPA